MFPRSLVPRLVLALTLGLLTAGVAASPRVVASIPPVHSLVAGVMAGVAEPELLIPPGASPHTYALRPSDARALARADAVFWIGPGLEAVLTDPLATIAGDARIVALYKAAGVRLLPYRTGVDWAGHGDEHGEHHAGEGPEVRGPHGHQHPADAPDMHIWLDPDNAGAMVDAIVETLKAVDPERAAVYVANGEQLQARLAALDARLRELVAPVSERPYIVFHDAYQYFERHYHMSPVGAVTLSPERRAGAGRLLEIRQRVEREDVECLFAEPQFTPDVVRMLTRGTGARRGVLDPLGAALTPGPDLYFRLMERMATALRDCLSAPN